MPGVSRGHSHKRGGGGGGGVGGHKRVLHSGISHL